MNALKPYIGRFAPSPSGPLHFGSLVTAVASYLDARIHQGKWLLRIEDIDPPREQIGASAAIQSTLEAHGLEWDESPLFQSERAEIYHETLHQLRHRQLSYRCACTRKRLSQINGHYDGFCIANPPEEDKACALRLNVKECHDKNLIDNNTQFYDRVQKPETLHHPLATCDLADFVIHRKDGLFAYQLAVVVDDIQQNISHIVRGCDLIDTTATQLCLTDVLAGERCFYAHIPIAVDSLNNKLSKQNHAPAIDNRRVSENLTRALLFLGVNIPEEIKQEAPTKILAWSAHHWDLSMVPKQPALPEPAPLA